jgi:spore coat protein H
MIEMRHAQWLRRPRVSPTACLVGLAGWLIGSAAWATELRPAVTPVITELMYHPPEGDAAEFIELHNPHSTEIPLVGFYFSGVTYVFPAESRLAPGQHLVLISDADTNAFRSRYPGVAVAGVYQGRLANGGERIALLSPNSANVTSVTYSDRGFWPRAPDGGGPSLELLDPAGDPRDPANWRASAAAGGTPGTGRPPAGLPAIRLNEIMAAPAPTDHPDKRDGDWIEIHNASPATADLSGWSLTDDGERPRRFVFAAGSSVPPGGWAVVACGPTPTADRWQAEFGLDREGQTVALFDAHTNLIDMVTFGHQVTGYSLGRGDADWMLTRPTPGHPNQAAVLAEPSHLAINEWYANSRPGESDWLELYNPNPQHPIALHGLTLGTAIARFQVRARAFVGAGECVQLFADEQPGPNHLDFRLPGAEGAIYLWDQAHRLVDNVSYPVQSEGVSQGRLPDGGLEFTFFPALSTPGALNFTDTDQDGQPDYWEMAVGLDPAWAGDAALDADGDGLSNLAEYVAGSDPRDPRQLLRLDPPRLVQGQLQLRFEATTNRSYSVIMGPNANLASAISVFDVPAAPTHRWVEWSVPVAATPGAQFYEVVTPRRPRQTALAIVTTAPTADAVGVLVGKPLAIVFSGAIDPAWVSSNTLRVLDDFARPVSGRVQLNADHSLLSFEPSLNLAHATRYRVALELRGTNVGGSDFTLTRQWTFTTREAPDLVEDRSVYAADDLEVRRLEVFLRPTAGGYSWEEVQADDYAQDDFEPWVPALVRMDPGGALNRAAPPNATIRQRGQSTRLTAQKSYRIDIADSAPPWQGQRRINLNKHPYDLTRVRNKLSFDLFTRIPHFTSLRTSFVNLVIDGVDFGLYTQIENPDAGFLQAHGLDPGGHLYKATFFEFWREADVLRSNADPSYSKRAFESHLEIRGHPNHAKFLAMLDDINDAELPFERVLPKYFNLDNCLTWLAVNILMGNLDALSQNFLLYSPSAESVWYLLPWDFDGAWGFYRQPNEVGANLLSRWQAGLPNWWGALLHRRFLQVPEYVAALDRRLTQLAGELADPVAVGQRLALYQPSVSGFVSQPPDVHGLPHASNDPLGEFRAEFARLTNWIDTAYAEYRDTLERPMPVFLGLPAPSDEGLEFYWDASFDLQGDPLTYDFQVSRSPDFAATSVVAEQLGLPQVGTVLRSKLEPGRYFWRVLIRDTKNPQEHWQVPFDSYYDPDTDEIHHGMAPFEVP